MENSDRPQTDYDGIWKEILDILLPWFLKLFCPDIYADIDWSIPPISLEKELYKINPEAHVGSRHVDKLFQVHRKQGREAWVYIHLEFQAQWISDLAERMFINYSLLYLRFRRPILSLAVLGDDCPNWRPERFESEIWGSRASLEFRTIKLWDYRDRIEELKQSGNPFAYFVLAHLRTLATQHDPGQRLIDKEAISLEMLERGFDEREVGYLLKFIDAMMTLPQDLEQTYLNKVYEYQEEKNMPIVAPIEKFYMEKMLEKGHKEGLAKGIKEGREEGREEGIQIGEKGGEQRGSVREAQAAVLDILFDRFGEIPESLIAEIRGLEVLALLRSLRRQAIKASSIEEFTLFLDESIKQSGLESKDSGQD